MVRNPRMIGGPQQRRRCPPPVESQYVQCPFQPCAQCLASFNSESKEVLEIRRLAADAPGLLTHPQGHMSEANETNEVQTNAPERDPFLRDFLQHLGADRGALKYTQRNYQQ